MLRFTPCLTTVLLAGAALTFAGSPAFATPSGPRAPVTVSPTAAQAQDTVELDQTRFMLPNGLTVLVNTDHSVPNIYVGVWYKIGSSDEPTGKTGFAHLFEHLMFQPTARRPQEYFQPLTEAGATDINGATNTDWTFYHQTVPTSALDRALWMEADRMANLADSITPAVLDEQRAVVKNEKREGDLEPGAVARERYRTGYYPADHPYAHDVIGSMEDLDAASLDDVKRWFDDYYGASNAVLVLSGDIDAATARAKVEQYFGGVRSGHPQSRLQQWTPDFGAVRRDQVFDNTPEAGLTRTWPLPNDNPRILTELRLAARTMAGARTSPLDRILVDDLGIASAVNVSIDERRLASSFTISVSLMPGIDPETARQALDQAVQSYLAAGPSQEALQAVVSATEVSLLKSLQDNASVASGLMDGYLNHGDPMFFTKRREWDAAATPESVRRTASTWLSRPYYELLNQPTPLLGAATEATADVGPMPQVGELSGDVEFPPISQAVLANGMKVVVAERRRLPMVDVSLRFATGAAAEEAYAPNASEQAFSLLAAGTRSEDAVALAARMERIGSTVGASWGERESAFNWSGLTRNLDATFALAAEMLRHPAYPQAEIDKRLSMVDSQFDGYERNPASAGSALFDQALWGPTHPNGRIERRDQAKAVSRDAVQRFHDREIGPDNATLYIVGDLSLDQAVALAERHFGDWRPVHPSSLPLPPAPQETGPRVILIDVPGAAQSTITAGHLVAPFDPETAATEALVDAALGGGFTSRLNLNLREDKGWTYGFRSGVSGGLPGAPRAFSARGAVQVDKTAESLVEIQREILAYTTTAPITEAELDRLKSASIRSIPSRYTSNTAYLTSIVGSASQGLALDRGATAGDRLAAVNLVEAQALAARTYRPADMIWVVAGDLSRIEAPVRALNLGPVEVQNVYGERLR